MPRPPLLERYFAQCQAHRHPPLPAFVAGIRDGVMEVNLADVALADIRLFALAVTDTTPVSAGGGAAAGAPAPARERRRVDDAGATKGDGSSTSSAHGPAAAFFSKLHFTYDPSSARRQRTGTGRGGAPSSPPPLLAPQSEASLRCLIEAVTQMVKENARTLRSFAWCGLPIVAPSRGPRSGGALSTSAQTLSLTQLLPLCRHLTSLRIDGVALSRAQFMQLTMISLSSSNSSAGIDGGSWLALEEASFVGCDLTDACKGGVVRLIRAALPIRRSLRSSAGSTSDPSLWTPQATIVSAGSTVMRGLRRLDLSGNPLGDETAKAIATAITGSTLHTLRLANTAVTSQGAALLLLPAVLEENAMELVDLSNTQVSTAYGTAAATSTSASAELRLLAASSINEGFRVVARGMGQLLVLREAVRTPQQPWKVRTAPAAPILTPSRASSRPQLLQREPEMSRASSRGRVSSVGDDEGEDLLSTADPFSAFLNTTPAPAASPHPRPSPASQRHQATLPSTDSRPSAALPPPPAPPPPPAGSPYGPWWSAWAPWSATQPSNPSSFGYCGEAPKPGERWVPVPLPVPVPVFAPLQLPYGLPVSGANPWTEAMLAYPSASAPSSSPAQPLTRSEPAGEKNSGTVLPAAWAAGAASSPPTSVAAAGEHPRREGETGEEDRKESDAAVRAGQETTEVVPIISNATQEPSLADDASSAMNLTHEASEAAGGSKFLTALIARLEAHETDVSERMEQQYQRTTSQLTAMEKDMRFRLQQLAEAGRKENATAVERQTALLDAIAEVREAPVRSAAEAMSEDMLSQLVHLIEVGMTRVQAVLEKDGVAKKEERSSVAKGPVSQKSPTAAIGTERDMVKETSQRLKQLGW